jgi:Protein of unknown function (DUF4089)
MSGVPTPEDLAAYVDGAARLIDLPIAAEHRPAVVRAMEMIVAAANLVMEFPLPDEIEAAPVFEP